MPVSHPHCDSVPSSSRVRVLDSVFPDRSRLIPPPYITTYDDYASWFRSAGGDLSPDKKRHTVAREEGHVSRPPNSFMLFRSWVALTAKSQTSNQSAFSKDVGVWWSELNDTERQEWARIANIVKINHMKLNPDYKYAPVRLSKASRAAQPAAGVSGGTKKATKCRRQRSPSTEPDSLYTSGEEDYSPLSPPLSEYSYASQTTLSSGPRRSEAKFKFENNVASGGSRPTIVSDYTCLPPLMSQLRKATGMKNPELFVSAYDARHLADPKTYPGSFSPTRDDATCSMGLAAFKEGQTSLSDADFVREASSSRKQADRLFDKWVRD